jgi:hypothetical protein
MSHCLSCQLPLVRGEVHGSSAQCAAALTAEIGRLKVMLSLRAKKAVPAEARDANTGRMTPAIALSRSSLR